MPNSKLKQPSRSNAIYPGGSKQSIFTQSQSSNELNNNISNLPQKNSCTTKVGEKSDFILDKANENIHSTTAANEDANKEKSFNIDWVDYEHKDKFQSNKATTRSNVNHRLTSAQQKLADSKRQRYIRTVDKQRSIKSESFKMDYSETSNKTFGSQRSSPINSTTLDIGNEFVGQSAGDIYFDDQELDGQLIDGGPPEVKQRLSSDYNQLDEPILDTLMRDLTGIYNKMKIIALPLSSYDIYKIVLKGWDLWGPLLLCTFLAFNLHHSTSKDDHVGPHFADVFVLVWFGSCVVSLNYRLLSISSVNNHVISSQILDTNQQKPASFNYDDSGPPLGNSSGGQTAISMSNQEKPFQTLLSPPSMFQLMCVFGYCLVAPCFGLIILKIFSFSRLFAERIIVGLLFGFAWPTFCSVRILIRYQHPEKRALAVYPIGLFYFVLSCMIILNH